MNKKGVLILIGLIIFLTFFYFWTPNVDNTINSNEKLYLYSKGFTDEIIDSLPYSFLIYVIESEKLGELIAYDRKIESNIAINTLIFNKKPDGENYNDYYLFIVYEGKYLLPLYKHEFTIDWNRNSYRKFTANSYFEGYNFLNRKTTYSEIPRGFGDEIFIPSKFKNAEGYIWFRIRQTGEGDIDFKGSYEAGPYNIQSIPTMLD